MQASTAERISYRIRIDFSLHSKASGIFVGQYADIDQHTCILIFCIYHTDLTGAGNEIM